jgi:hypothetical protein
MNAGSRAAKVREPRQVRKEAAVSDRLRVPWGYLAGAGSRLARGLSAVDAGCTTGPPRYRARLRSARRSVYG